MRVVPRIAGRLSAPALVLLLASCGGDDSPNPGFPPPPPPPPPADTTPPTAPGALTANATSTTQINLTWTASTDAGTGVAGYRVFRNAGATAIATVTTTNYSDTGLTAATLYSYTVRAFDAATPANESAPSTAASATTNALPPVDTTPPTVPGGLTATASSDTQINLAWTASTDAGAGVAGYRVFRNGGATAIATVTTTNYSDTGLTAATMYSYTVRAFDAATPANVSGPSATASATTNAAPPPPLVLTTQRVFTMLPDFSQPIAMLQEPGNSARWYVVQKTGSVRVFDNTANVTTSREFINLGGRLNSDPNSSTDERGLLGMAFHPNYPTNPRAYLFYTGTEPGLGLVDRVSEFRMVDNGQGPILDPATELVLFNVDDPEGNHNGGNIAFGPDNMLYIGIGDGGGGGDVHGTIGNGQLLTTLLGKVLRIDVSAATMAQTYTIPPDNPFANNPARCNTSGTGAATCPEIYAYGLRNPWRWSFDRVSGELWLNDVGQGALEEVDRIVSGGNYGWRCFEGTNVYTQPPPPQPDACGTNRASSIAPVAQYGRSLGQSTTGGFVYRGSAIPNLQGRYVFGDFATGNLWNISRTTTPTLTLPTGADPNRASTGLQIASFAQDTDGELYIVHLGGTLHRIVAQ